MKMRNNVKTNYSSEEIEELYSVIKKLSNGGICWNSSKPKFSKLYNVEYVERTCRAYVLDKCIDSITEYYVNDELKRIQADLPYGVRYYRNADDTEWIRETLTQKHVLDRIVMGPSSMINAVDAKAKQMILEGKRVYLTDIYEWLDMPVDIMLSNDNKYTYYDLEGVHNSAAYPESLAHSIYEGEE